MLRHILLLLLAMPALGGCVTANVIAFAVRPLFTPQPAAMADAADARETARRHFAEGRFGDAAWHYRKALANDRNSVAVLNGLAASYDRLGRYDLAERFYHEALALDPLSPQTLNNLGYSYYLQGKPDLALAYLGHAPADAADSAVMAANRNLAEAALESGAPAPAAAIAPAATPKAAVASSDERPPVRAVGRPSTPQVEIANGTGRGGMAARFGVYLRGKGVAVARLANARPFDKAATTIFYRRGSRARAEEIAALLPAPVRLAQATEPRAPVRIELGRDLIALDNQIATSMGELSNDAANRTASTE